MFSRTVEKIWQRISAIESDARVKQSEIRDLKLAIDSWRPIIQKLASDAGINSIYNCGFTLVEIQKVPKSD